MGLRHAEEAISLSLSKEILFAEVAHILREQG
jgi:hypothetical protein